MRYVPPDEFGGYAKVAYTKGFLMVSARPADPARRIMPGMIFARFAGGTRRENPAEASNHADILQASARAHHQRATDVRSGGRWSERYPEFVPLCKSLKDPPSARQKPDGTRDRDRRHDGCRSSWVREAFYQPG